MAAMLFRRRHMAIPLTESHPKAMLWLLRKAVPGRPTRDVALADLSEYFSGELHNACDHERDAALATHSAFATTTPMEGWENLYTREINPIAPFDPMPGYWLPRLG